MMMAKAMMMIPIVKMLKLLKKLREGSRGERAGGAAAPPYFAKF